MRILKLWLSLPETVTQSVGSLYINLLIIIDYCWLLIDYWYLLIYDLLILSLLSDNFTRSVVCRLVVCIACDRVEHLLVWLVLYTWSLHPTFSFRTFLSFVIYFILFHKFVDGVILSYGGDTQSRNLYKWTCTRNLPSDMVSCTIFFLYKFLAPNTAQVYSIQETCMHVTRMVSSDWSAAYHCHCFHFVVDNLLYKVNIVCLLIFFIVI